MSKAFTHENDRAHRQVPAPQPLEEQAVEGRSAAEQAAHAAWVAYVASLENGAGDAAGADPKERKRKRGAPTRAQQSTQPEKK